MSTRKIDIERNTKETRISLSLDMNGGPVSIETKIPFFNHILNAMAFHGKIGLTVKAEGDTEVDPHHLVEDTGIVLGSALKKTVEQYGPVTRFGHAVIPMDEALSEVTLDAGGRGYPVYKAKFPQEYSGKFHMPLLREFFIALSSTGGITLHAECRYGENSHHMAESLFKALGRALSFSYRIVDDQKVLSTKGTL